MVGLICPINSINPINLFNFRQFFRRPLNRIHNVRIPSATAQVAFQAVGDFFACRLRVALEQLHAGHDHSGRAVAALQTVTFPEPLLDGVQLAVAGQAFNGGDFAPIGLDGEQGARLGGLAVEQDRAGAADAGLAADVRAGQPAVLAQKMDQQGARLDLVLLLNTVDFDSDQTFHAASENRFSLRSGLTKSIGRAQLKKVNEKPDLDKQGICFWTSA